MCSLDSSDWARTSAMPSRLGGHRRDPVVAAVGGDACGRSSSLPRGRPPSSGVAEPDGRACRAAGDHDVGRRRARSRSATSAAPSTNAGMSPRGERVTGRTARPRTARRCSDSSSVRLELVPHGDVRRQRDERHREADRDRGQQDDPAGQRPPVAPATDGVHGAAHGSLQHVADAAHRVDQPRLALGLGLAAQVADVDLEGVRGRREVVAPDLLEDERAVQHPARAGAGTSRAA